MVDYLSQEWYSQWITDAYRREYWRLSDKKKLRRDTRKLKRMGLAKGDLF